MTDGSTTGSGAAQEIEAAPHPQVVTDAPDVGDPRAAPEPQSATDAPDVTDTDPPDLTDARAAPEPPLREALEAVLIVVDEPVDETTLAQVVRRPTDEVAAALAELAAEYDAQRRGFQLRRVAGGWRFYSRDTCVGVVERYLVEGQQARLTKAALETLAVVAYRQPVSRARVSAVRGVNVDGVMRTLVSRGLLEEAGPDDATGATLYRTTTYFLERLGLTSLDELPELAPFLPEIEMLDELIADEETP